MNDDGTLPIRLTTNTAFDSDPSRSADGAQIVFASTRDGDYEIYIANADGSAQPRLTTDPSSDIEPSLLTFTPTFASVSGRVTTPDGRGLRNATVKITDANNVTRTVTTSSFGFYTFDNVPTGFSYTIAISSTL